MSARDCLRQGCRERCLASKMMCLKAKRTNDRKRKSAALDADESSRGSKRHQQQHGAVAQFVSAGKLDNVDNAIRAAVTLRQAVTNGDDTCTSRSRTTTRLYSSS
mmetsp:Transcript_32423/g.97646  ORF Transcript_32423/g.97646 Transcript_32423/m.97646 type:complete len:105 (+) Transcript_32423:1280-1594(+)